MHLQEDNNASNAILRLENLEKRMEELIQMQRETIRLQEEIKNGTNKMENHITFIENIYEICKKPFKKLLGYYYSYYEPGLQYQIDNVILSKPSSEHLSK